ncbi:Transcription factor bHLH148 [Apostasia shenzhenica]|uniref:Transcription factor bHLH148 n=1 Tax=Apostasia shenzhenica TaxID=1088818 RepID=A0A2I0B3E6_9ASPA|nr:Transcription factor bHLH148 [Apostasia shenzhenica]
MALSDADGDSAAKEGDRKRKRSEVVWRPPMEKWRTVSEQKTYSSKLLLALRHVRSYAPAADLAPRSRAVREAADRALAVAARGRTRWSRAILSHRKRRQRWPRSAAPSSAGPRFTGECSRSSAKKKSRTVLNGKAAVLGRLVPGCRKLSLSTLLEEASDYIAALEMQVRAMSTLTAILSAAGGSSSPQSERITP